MTTRTRWVAVLALALVTLSLTPAAVAREERATYTTGADLVTSCEQDVLGSLLGTNYGSVCFDVHDGETNVDLAIEDFALSGVGGAVKFEDAAGEQIGDFASFCGSVSGLSIPDGATTIEVYVNGPAFQFVDCGTIASSTVGEVTATFG